jgi:hypothetical protein
VRDSVRLVAAARGSNQLSPLILPDSPPVTILFFTHWYRLTGVVNRAILAFSTHVITTKINRLVRDRRHVGADENAGVRPQFGTKNGETVEFDRDTV